MKVVLSSLTYSCMGHSKPYINELLKRIPDCFGCFLYKYGNESCAVNSFSCKGDYGKLNYIENQMFASYRKLIRRFLSSFKFYVNLKKKVSKDVFIYFMDYEYLSLLLFLPIFNKNKKAIWIHSASLGNKYSFYFFYKKIFFKLISFLSVKNTKFIVNGDYTKEELHKYLPYHQICVFQYPSDITLDVINKDVAKSKLGISGKKVFSSLGMLREDKNYDELFYVFSRSKFYNDRDSILLIAGALSNLTESYFIELKNKYSLDNVKIIYKYFNEDEMNLLFSATDIYLMTYGFNGSSQSGPLSLCRHYGIPCIVYDGGEVGNYVKKNSVGYAVKSKDEFVSRVNTISYGEFSVNIEKANEKYSWNNLITLYKDLFKL